MKREVLFLIVFSMAQITMSQTEIPDVIEQSIEKIAESTENDIDFSDLADDLEQLKNRPINLNNTNPEQLSRITFLSDRQINNLILYQLEYGKIFTLFELQAIEGFDSATILKMAPFILLGDEPNLHKLKLKNILEYGRSQLFLRYQQVIQKQQGYSVPDSIADKSKNSKYLGNPARYYFRYSYNYYDRLSIGLTGEKDPGEAFFGKYQPYGMDFYGGYISLNNTGFLKNLVIGNFNAEFGQGLTLGSGLSMGSVPGISNRRFARGIRPSLSVNENDYLFGVGTTLKVKKVDVSLFYSNHRKDGNITRMDSATSRAEEISSFQETGYHRLPGENEDKNAVREILYGGNLSFRNQVLKAGITSYYSHWSAEFLPGIYPYNQFNFRGKDNLNAGLDLQFVFRNVYFFGEVAGSRNGGMAWLAGFQANPDPRLALSATYRNYGRDYQNLRSNATGQNSKNSNEEGCTVAVNLQLPQSFVFSGFMDICRFPWLKYDINSPSWACEYQLQLNYSKIRSVPMYVRFRYSKGMTDLPGEPLPLMSAKKKYSARYQAEWQISAYLKLKSRFEMVADAKGNSPYRYGYLISQQLAVHSQKKLVGFNILYALFDTESYDERVYMYENDVLYGYSVPALYGQGIRFAALITFSPVRWLDFWLKYAQTWYYGQNRIGSDLNTVEGNTLSEAKIQVRVRF